ncbi:hypothetical protein [Hydrogenophaga sp.]|uniref:hypothetical protein n=1 Tax=Hydrogenophaga sp. TaxID=1904254 RepID=UPI00260DBFA5|nr:hypothetical protein [Hydrogenophaga sp.]MDM7950087.1 hypothetical protein [Hydrogenophaga sp.]
MNTNLKHREVSAEWVTTQNSKTRSPEAKRPQKLSKKPADTSASKTHVLEIEGDPKDIEKLYAESAVGGMVSNMMLMQTFGKRLNGEVGITQAVKALRSTLKEVHAGSLQSSETLLYSQAVALNAMFAELACRAGLNMGSYPQAAESYMRLALKAQSQCRNTLETLANIKNPPVVFARQANISNGPQQVNNGVPTNFETSTRAHAPAQACGETENQPSKLLEGLSNGSTTLDAGTARAAARSHQELETVGAVHRAKERSR